MQFLPCGSTVRRERGRGGSDGRDGRDGRDGHWGDIPSYTSSSAAPTCCPSTQPDTRWVLESWLWQPSWAKLGHPS